MTISDESHTIAAARATGPSLLHLSWSDGTEADIDLRAALADRAFTTLADPSLFAQVEIGDWGHSLIWPSGAEMGADSLWLETLSATQRDDTRRFLEWRLRHGLSIPRAAATLGVPDETIAHYSSGRAKVPPTILRNLPERTITPSRHSGGPPDDGNRGNTAPGPAKKV